MNTKTFSNLSSSIIYYLLEYSINLAFITIIFFFFYKFHAD